jgi:hypothetical protein
MSERGREEEMTHDIHCRCTVSIERKEKERTVGRKVVMNEVLSGEG